MDEKDPRERDGMGEEEFAALLKSISAAAPVLKGLFSASSPTTAAVTVDNKKGGSCSNREALLLGLRPYLSPARAAAVDYLIRIGRIGDALRALQ